MRRAVIVFVAVGVLAVACASMKVKVDADALAGLDKGLVLMAEVIDNVSASASSACGAGVLDNNSCALLGTVDGRARMALAAAGYAVESARDGDLTTDEALAALGDAGVSLQNLVELASALGAR